MTLSTKTTIKTYFETGDKPTAGNFSDFIDSCVFLQETSSQSLVGSLSVGGDFIVSGNARIGGIVSANAINTNTLNITTLNATTVSAATGNFTNILAGTVSATTAFANTVNATNVNAAVSASTLTSTSTTTLQGTSTNDSAAAGKIGEYTTSNIGSGSAVACTNGNTQNITFVPLTAGDWDVWGTVFTLPAGGTVTSVWNAGIATASSALPTAPNNGGFITFGITAPAGQTTSGFMSMRLSLAASANAYLMANVNFSVSTCSLYGSLQARRRR